VIQIDCVWSQLSILLLRIGKSLKDYFFVIPTVIENARAATVTYDFDLPECDHPVQKALQAVPKMY
jgi:hypothetical protein